MLCKYLNNEDIRWDVEMSKGIFITATGTDVGKTYVTGLLVKKLRDSGLNCGYYKAALSGAEVIETGLLPGDADYVNTVAGIGEKIENMVSYVYKEAVSPHLASKLEGKPVNMEVVKTDYEKAREKYDYLAVEGCGGIICPIRWDDQKILLEDLIVELQLSVIIVADAGLGTINSSVLTVEYLKQRDISIKGIILNHAHKGNMMEEDNKKMIEELTGIPVIALVEENETELDIEVERLVELFS